MGSGTVLIDLDQSTMANMTAALESVCRRLPKDKDSRETRKAIADAMVACAHAGKPSYIDLENAGMKALKLITAPRRPAWLSALMSWFR